MSIKAAFFEVCEAAQPAQRAYVSLYVDRPYYGGPEEGGWWGSDTELVAYQEVSNEVDAKAITAQVNTLAAELSKSAKDAFNRNCQAETEWLEARGLDDDYLREVDGAESYWVTTEDRPGSCASQGSRYYE